MFIAVIVMTDVVTQDTVHLEHILPCAKRAVGSIWDSKASSFYLKLQRLLICKVYTLCCCSLWRYCQQKLLLIGNNLECRSIAEWIVTLL